MIRLYTFHITGGEPFEMHLYDHPSLNHTGKTTVWTLLGTKEHADAAKLLMIGQGAEVDMNCQTQTDEQLFERIGGTHALPEVDYTQFDEGIRYTVQVLREAGFHTCDSGDGTKMGMGCALEFPNVHIRISPVSNLVPEAHRVREVLEAHGATVKGGDIQATFDPMDGLAILSVFHIALEA